MTKAGRSAREIAEELSIHKATVLRMRKEAGVSGRVNQPWTQLELDRAAALFADGCSLSEVARTVGRPISSVRKRFPGLAWTWAEVAEYNRAHKAFEVFPEQIGPRK